MRWGMLLVGLSGLWWVSGAAAQTAPQRVQQRIMVAEVEVRSGPSLSYYPTSKLRQNEPVVVLGPASQDPRWLRIEPPRGSFSWIEERYVRREGIYAYVTEGEEVPVLVGSALVDKKPTVEGAKVKKGTLLVVVGEPLSDGTSRWLPIQPTEHEVRYLPAEAVAGSETIPLPPRGAPANPAASGGSVAQASPASEVRALIQQADSAYRARDYATASRLYEAAARAPQSSYADKAYCYTQLAQLSQQPVSAARPAATATQALSPTATSSFSSGSSGSSSAANPATAGQWSPWGRLRKTAIAKEGRPVYVLEDAHGHPLIYAVAYPGMTLDPHVGKFLTLYGSVEYWSDQYMRTNLMTVSQVAIQPGS